MGARRNNGGHDVDMPHRVNIRVPGSQDRGADFLRRIEWIETSEQARGFYSMMSANDLDDVVYTYWFSDADTAFVFKLAHG